MNEPRPATISALPFESRSRVANSWNTRTGSAALRTVTALVNRIRRVRADRKSTRLNSSHQIISYAVFCLKKKKLRGMGGVRQPRRIRQGHDARFGEGEGEALPTSTTTVPRWRGRGRSSHVCVRVRESKGV